MGVLAQLTAWEAGNLWRISWASILITLFSFTLSLMTQMFVGHLGELEPAGASISNIDIQGLPYGVNAPITGTGTFFFMKRWNRDFQIMLGLSYAASIRVGNELGAGHPKVARFSVIVVVMPSITFSVFVTLLVIILSTLYTSSTTVIEAVISLMPLLAFSIFLNGIQPILSGAAIGSGWQAIVAYVNVGAYYLIGLPIGCILGYKTSLGAAGIWWRLIIGVTVQTIALIILTARTNWDNEVEKAMQQLQQTGVVPVNDIIAGPKESTWLTLFWC